MTTGRGVRVRVWVCACEEAGGRDVCTVGGGGKEREGEKKLTCVPGSGVAPKITVRCARGRAQLRDFICISRRRIKYVYSYVTFPPPLTTTTPSRKQLQPQLLQQTVVIVMCCIAVCSGRRSRSVRSSRRTVSHTLRTISGPDETSRREHFDRRTTTLRKA